MKYLLSALCLLVGLSVWAEESRTKNTATYIPIYYRNATTGALITGATGSDCECSNFADGSAPSTFADCTNEASEIATSSGVYRLQLASGDINYDYVIIKCTCTSTDCLPYTVTISTTGGAAGSVKSGGITSASFASGAIDATAIATDAIGANEVAADAIGITEIASPARDMLADVFWRRNSSNIEASSYGDTVTRMSGYGVIAQQTHKMTVVGDTLTNYKSDGTTSLSTRTVTSSSSAAPITGIAN